MAQETLYELLKDYEDPCGRIYKGVRHTERQWMRLFPMLGLGDCKIKDDWFRDVDDPMFNMDDLKSFVMYTLNCIDYKFIDSLEMTKIFVKWCEINKKAVETK